MKKIMLLLAASLFFAASAMAGTLDISEGGKLTSGSGDKDPSKDLAVLSSNVVGTVVSSADQFSAITKHKNGSKNFATSSESTSIFAQVVSSTNEGTTTFEITLSASDTSEFADWSVL